MIIYLVRRNLQLLCVGMSGAIMSSNFVSNVSAFVSLSWSYLWIRSIAFYFKKQFGGFLPEPSFHVSRVSWCGLLYRILQIALFDSLNSIGSSFREFQSFGLWWNTGLIQQFPSNVCLLIVNERISILYSNLIPFSITTASSSCPY